MSISRHKIFILIGLLVAVFCLAGFAVAIDVGGRPSDKELYDWMRRPALETLSAVDCVFIDDENFETEVVRAMSKVMVIYITDAPKFQGKNNSRGIAALARALKIMYPQLKLCVYMVNEIGFVNPKEFKPLIKKYELRTIPCMFFYRDIEGLGHNQRMLAGLENGITWDNDLTYQVDKFSRNFIPDNVLFF